MQFTSWYTFIKGTTGYGSRKAWEVRLTLILIIRMLNFNQ